MFLPHLKAALACLAFTASLTCAAQAQSYPVTIEHQFGTTVIESQPQRVVSLSYSGHDDILALGVVPVALRYWYGDYPQGVFPWAQDALGGAEPVQLKGDLNIEQIAALQPDVILGISSGITAEEYGLLSQIAPTIASPAQYGDWGTPWQVADRIRGKVLGKQDEAERQITTIEDRFAAVAAAHPDWQGKTAAVAFYWNDAPGAYRSIDARARFLNELGFETPAAINAAGGEDEFFVSLSNEDISALDADLLIWFGTFGEISNVALRETLEAHKQGREIFAPELLADAFSHSSLLSLNYALDELVPLIELAVDGDPATEVPGPEMPE